MTERATELRNWVLRTVGTSGTSMNDLRQHFTVQHPDRPAADLEEILRSRQDFAADESGNVALTEGARRELEEIGRHEYSRRARRES